MAAKTRIALLIGFAVAFLIVEFAAQTAHAIPAFARKYETSCVTCHTAFPKLNSFGEAFRLSGYQYPEDDEEMTKDEPVSLGSEAYKRVFPDAVWPNDIPGKPPLSLRVSSAFNYVDDTDISNEFVAPSLNLMAAGTLGQSIGFYAGAHLFEEGETGSIDRAFIQINNIFGGGLPEKAINIRIGQFIPNMVAFANHRGLSLTPYAFNTFSALQDEFAGGHVHGGGETFGIEDFQLGLEASGFVGPRWRWGAGLVNGNGPGGESNSAKDGYGRLAVKLGGMGFDGSGPAAEASGKNWRDDSVILGAMGFLGSYPNTGIAGPVDLDRYRYGVDVNVLFRDLNLFGGYLFGSDDTMEDTTLHQAKYGIWFTEANYVVFPWLIGIGRFEQADPEDAAKIERLVAGFTALYRANVKFVVESTFDTGTEGFNDLQIKVDFAM